MNSSSPLQRRARLRARLFVLAAAVAAVVSVNGASEPADAKTHTLFMGIDLSVEHNKTFHRVRDVSGGSFIITARGEPVFLPVNRSAHNLKVQHALKLTRASASVTNLASARAYTPRNNPQMQRLKEMAATTAALQDSGSLAMGKYVAAENRFGVVPSISPYPVAPGYLAEIQATREQAVASQAMAAQQMGSDIPSGNFSEARAREDMALELFDAIETRFEVSAETPLNNPYVLLVARFRGPKDPPSAARNWIYAKSLDPVDSRPQEIHVVQGGFPPGYLLEDFSVHLFDRGNEVATNVSRKRVALSREDAFEYVKIQYLASNKDATVPAVPAMGQLPSDFHKRISGGQFNRTYYVKVSKDGMAGEAFMDEACSERIEDPYLDSVVKKIRFKPALEKGKPVESVAPLKLDNLPL